MENLPDLTPIETKENLASEQLKNSIDQSLFWLEVAASWADDMGLPQIKAILTSARKQVEKV